VRVQLESTTKIVQIRGPLGEIPARVWEGETESGIKVHAFMTRIAVHKDEDVSQFEAELQECRAPSADVQAYPMRIIL
jgi:hypothetical protein